MTATSPTPTKSLVATTSQTTKTSNNQRPTRLSCSQRYRLGLTKAIKRPDSQPFPLQGLETPVNGLQSSPKISPILPESTSHSSLTMRQTSKISEQIETNLRQNITETLSQLDSMNSYGFGDPEDDISVKIQVDTNFNKHACLNSVRSSYETSSSSSASSQEDENVGRSSERKHHQSTMCETAKPETTKLTSSEILKTPQITNSDLKKHVNGDGNLSEKGEGVQQNGSVLGIQKRSHRMDTVKEINVGETEPEYGKEDFFIQNDLENTAKSFHSQIAALREEHLNSNREEEQNLFQNFSGLKNVHDGFKFFSFEEYDDILEVERYERIINSGNNCPLGSIIEENEDAAQYVEEILNLETKKPTEDHERKEELNLKSEIGKRDKIGEKWAEITSNIRRGGTLVGNDAMQNASTNDLHSIYDEMSRGKCYKSERREHGLTCEGFDSDEKNKVKHSKFFTTDVEYPPSRPRAAENIKVSKTPLSLGNNPSNNHDTNQERSRLFHGAQRSKIQNKQSPHLKKITPGKNSDKLKNSNTEQNLKSYRRKSISPKCKPQNIPLGKKLDSLKFEKRDVDYCKFSSGSKTRIDINVQKQVKNKKKTLELDELANSIEDSDNNSGPSSELSLTSGSGSSSSGRSKAVSNEFKNCPPAPKAASREYDQTDLSRNHSLQNGFEEREEDEDDLNAPCSSASSDSLLDEFLGRSSRLRIVSLQKKLQAQDAALDHLKKVNQQLSDEKQERQRRLQESEARQRRTAAQLRQAKLAVSAAEQRRAAADEQAKLQLKKNQNLTTEMAVLRRSSAGQNAGDPVAVRRLQNNLVAAAAAREKLQHQVQTLQRDAASAAAEHQQQLSQLRLQVRQLQLLIQKQRQLIAVLQKQKISILAAKATECLERRLNSIVSDKK